MCEECAGCHRQLGWAVSKLKNIALDEFYEWQLRPLSACLGNDVVNNIWEISIPSGWVKPVPTSAVEDKAQYIVGKYKWYGFVDEFSASDVQLADGIYEAVVAGNIPQVMWWMSHKSDVNSVSVLSGQRQTTPLHEAIARGNVELVGFLLQNGADIYAVDGSKCTPLRLSERVLKAQPQLRDSLRIIINMLLSVQRGDY